MKLKLPAGETSDTTVLIIASRAIETGSVKKSPRARTAVGAAVCFFVPMAGSHAQASPGTTHGIVNIECAAWRDQTSRYRAKPVMAWSAHSRRECPIDGP